MRIIIDSNILLSACITPVGKISDILINPLYDIEKYTCHYLIVELFNHQDKIIKYSKLPKDEVSEVLYSILKKIDFINEEQISEVAWQKANELTKDIDNDDIAFVALTIHLEGILWTGDKTLYKKLYAKGFKNVILTDELLKLLKK